METTQSRAAFPFASLLALLVVGLLIAYLIQAETPRGTVTGQVLLAVGPSKELHPLPNSEVYLNGGPSDYNGTHATTDSEGRFVLRRVPVGEYRLSASARWHDSPEIKLTVSEATTASTRVVVSKRNQPDINIGDRQAAFSTNENPILPIRGYVMGAPPNDDSGKLPAPEKMTVRIWKTRLSEVLRRSDAADALQQLNYNYDGPTPKVPDIILKPEAGVAAPPQFLGETTIPVTQADREGFYVERVPLVNAKGKPGLYLVQCTLGKKSATSYVVVSDLALVTKRSRSELLGYVVDIRTGTPIPAAEVRCYRAGKLAVSQVSDKQGLARLTVPAPPRPANEDEEESRDVETLAIAIKGQDEAVVSRVNYWGNSGADTYTVHTVTDRTVYRPGDTVQYKVIARTRRDTPNGDISYSVPTNVPATVEVRDPTGALVIRETKMLNSRGTYSGSFEVNSEGATGTYSVVSIIGREKHTADVKIASYKKPEFSVTVTPDRPNYMRGEPVEMTVSAQYYFGTPVAGGKVTYYVYRDTDWFASYGLSEDDLEDGETAEEYLGHDSYYGSHVTDGTATLDENGKFKVVLSAAMLNPPGKNTSSYEDHRPQAERLTITASVEDDANRMTEADGIARILEGDLLVSVSPEGYVAEPGKASSVFADVRDTEGKPVSGVTVQLLQSYQRWDAKANESVTEKVGSAITATSGADGRAIFSVTPTKKGDLTLTASLRDSKNRVVRGTSNLWVVDDAGGDLNTDYGDLTLLTDKKRYLAGETARILVNSSRMGQTVLLTVEGDRVYHSVTIPITKRSTVIRLPVLAGWGPNVSLNACYVRDKKFAQSETPLRVRVRAREVAVTIQPDKEKYGPGDTATYTIETKDKDSGRPLSADIAFGVVDEGIFALRPDDPTGLKSTFWPRRTNEVNTTFSFSVQYLGDADKTEPVIEARKKFRDTAFWEPYVRTDASGRATVRVPLPDNLTTWRATAKAITERTAVGYGISKVISTKPFFVRLETPRFLTGGDSTRLLALVHNETGQEQQALVRLVAPNTLQVSGKDTQTITVPAGGVGKVEWPVTVSANTSEPAPLRLTAWTPQVAGKTQFTDGIETKLPLRPYGRAQFQTFTGVLDTQTEAAVTPAGSPMLTAATNQASLTLDPNTIPAEIRLKLRVTPSLRGALSSGLEYLIGFPYGCTEQTMSRFYPDLLAQRLNLVTDPAQVQALPRMVRNGIARLLRFQHESGGWGWWENDTDDGFMTAYVLLGLSEAKVQGYPVEESVLRKGQEAAAKLSKPATEADTKAFLLYALSVSGYDDSKDNILHAPFKYSHLRTGLDLTKMQSQSLAYLVLLGKKIGANTDTVYAELQRRAKVEGRLIHWETGRYDSGVMVTSLALRAILATNPQDSRIPAILRWLMQNRTDSYFGNTRDTSWALVALCDYLRLHPEEAGATDGELTVLLNGSWVQTLDLVRDGKGEPEFTVSLPTNLLKVGENQFEVKRTRGTGVVFYSGALRQTVSAPTGQDLPALDSDAITIKREYFRIKPRSGEKGSWRLESEPVSNLQFQQGDQIRVRLTLSAKKSASYILIEDFFPSGLEVTQRGTDSEEIMGSWGYWYDHIDVRDDRIAFFARKIEGSPAPSTPAKGATHPPAPAPRLYQLEYNLRAQTPGTSQALPAHLEGMYDATVKADSSSNRVEVKP